MWIKLIGILTSALVTLGLMLLDYRYHDKRTRIHKRLRVAVQGFVFLALLFTASSVWKDEQSQNELKSQIRTLHSEIATVRKEAEARGFALSAKNEELLEKSEIIIQKTETIAELREEVAKAKDHTANLVVGGDSYCHVAISRARGSDKVGLMLLHQGKYPMYNVQVTLRDIDHMQRLQAAGKLEEWIKTNLLNALNIGDLPAGTAARLGELDLKGLPLRQRWIAQIEARNGSFHQPIRLHKINGEWKLATRVGKFGSKAVLYEHVDEGYPRNSNGDIEW